MNTVLKIVILYISFFTGLVKLVAQNYSVHWNSAFVLAVNPELSEKDQIDTLHYLKSLAKSEGFPDYEPLFQNALGVYYYQIDNFPKMLQHVLKAKEINQATGNDRLLSMNYNMLSLYYQDIGRPEKALEPQQMALNIAEQLEETSLYHLYSSNLATVFMILERYEEALPVQKINLEFYKERSDTNNICSEIYNIAYGYHKTGRNKEALEILAQLDLYYNQNAVQWEVNTLALMLEGLIYMDENQFVRSKEMFLEAYAIAERIQSLTNLASITENLMTLHQKKGDYKEALAWAMKNRSFQDSLLNKKNLYSLNEMEVKYEAEVRRQELAAANAQMEALQKQKIIMVFVFVLALFTVLGFVMLFYNRSQLKQRELELNHKQIDELLSNQELGNLKAALKAKEEERNRIARELHDQLSSKMAALKLNLSYWIKKKEAQSEEDSQKIMVLIKDVSDDIRRVSHELSSVGVDSFGIRSALESLQDQLNNKRGLEFHLSIYGLDDSLPSDLETHIYRIIQELVANTLKHAKAGKISLSLTRIKDEITLMYDDNGIGFDLAKTSTQYGIGMKNIRERVKTCKGTLQIDTTPGSGFSAVAVFPLPIEVSL